MVERRHFPREYAHGPAVYHDVMGNDHEHVLFMPEPQQCRTQEWADGQIYRAVKLVNDQLPPLLLTLCLRQSAEVDDCQRHERGRGDDLNWLAVNRAEGCAQNFVPAHNLCEGAFQRGNVEAPLEANRNRNVVGVVARVQLLEEPQSLLRERQLKLVALYCGSLQR